MKCSEIMNRVVYCHLDDPIFQVARRMRDLNIGFMPVCDDHGRMVGVVTDRDLAMRVIAERRDSERPVGEVMTTEIVACRPDDDLRIAEQRMEAHEKSRIVCLDDQGKPVGVISLSDLARYEWSGRAAELLRHITRRETPGIP